MSLNPINKNRTQSSNKNTNIQRGKFFSRSSESTLSPKPKPKPVRTSSHKSLFNFWRNSVQPVNSSISERRKSEVDLSPEEKAPLFIKDIKEALAKNDTESAIPLLKQFQEISNPYYFCARILEAETHYRNGNFSLLMENIQNTEYALIPTVRVLTQLDEVDGNREKVKIFAKEAGKGSDLSQLLIALTVSTEDIGPNTELYSKISNLLSKNSVKEELNEIKKIISTPTTEISNRLKSEIGPSKIEAIRVFTNSKECLEIIEILLNSEYTIHDLNYYCLKGMALAIEKQDWEGAVEAFIKIPMQFGHYNQKYAVLRDRVEEMESKETDDFYFKLLRAHCIIQGAGFIKDTEKSYKFEESRMPEDYKTGHFELYTLLKDINTSNNEPSIVHAVNLMLQAKKQMNPTDLSVFFNRVKESRPSVIERENIFIDLASNTTSKNSSQSTIQLASTPSNNSSQSTLLNTLSRETINYDE